MPRLFIFGDSFGDHKNHLKESWSYTLGQKLGASLMENYSIPGCSNEYIQYKINEKLVDIDSKDHVVILVTNKSRKWFFKEQPDMGNYFGITDISRFVSDSKAKAIEAYTKHLFNPDIETIYYEAFLAWCNWTAVYKKLNFLCVPCFENHTIISQGQYQVKGNLFFPSVNEIARDAAVNRNQYWIDKNKGQDPRSGHLSLENHKVLCEKLFKTFSLGETLDLTTGFKTGFLR